MKRILAILLLFVCLCPAVWADREVPVNLNITDKTEHREQLGFGEITFKYLKSSNNKARIMVTVENITQNPPLAILIFRRDMEESRLKKNKPKIEFDKKKFPGDKDRRIARGNGLVNGDYIIVTPTENVTVFTVDVSFTSPKDIKIPFYLAQYKPKDLQKKGKDDISYKILEQQDFKFTLDVVGWTENDTEYVRIKESVDSFVTSLDGVTFCNNKKHPQSLADQQMKYKTVKDDLTDCIVRLLESSGWMVIDPPYVAYNKLLDQLNSVDLDAYVRDCGRHNRKAHKCGYCGLSAQQIFHRLDDTYQQLYSGRISGDSAVKTAKSLYACFQNNKSRKKDPAYTRKITEYYNRIINY